MQEQQQLGTPRSLTILQEDSSEGLEDMGDYVTCDYVNSPVSLRDGVMCDPDYECDPMSQSNSPTSTQQADDHDMDEVMVTASLPTMHLDGSSSHTPTAAAAATSAAAAPTAAAATSLDGAAAVVLQQQDTHSKVSQWLQPISSSSSSNGQKPLPLRKSWQEWQQELPLEPMSSGGSSSGSLALALPDV